MRATFYQVLGIPPNAKMRQIRVAIRSMLMTATVLPLFKDEKELPDAFKAPNMASDLFCLAHHASLVLLDSRKRGQYDQCLAKNLHRQNINQNRYRTLLQYTGGATRRVGGQNHSLSHGHEGTEHLGLLPVGFKWSCEEYWACIRGVCAYGIVFTLLCLQLFFVWKGLLEPRISKEGIDKLSLMISAGKTAAELGVCVIVVLVLYKLKSRLRAADEIPDDKSVFFDGMTWSMLELSESWRNSDRIFLGEDPIHEDAAWVFRVKMGHLIRGEVGMAAQSAPFRRAWARVVDMAFWGSVCLIPFHFRLFHSVQWLQNPFFATLLWMWLTATSWVLVEAWCLSVLETTLGRCVAGVTLHFRATTFLPVKLDKLTWYSNFPVALKRTWAVWWYGLGAGILPFGVWFTVQFLSSCKNRKETLWDSHADSIVMVHPASIGYTMMGIGLLLGVIAAWSVVFFANV